MKKLPALFALSLVANLILAAAFLLRPGAASNALGSASAASTGTTPSATAATASKTAATPATEAPASPDAAARQLAVGRAFEKLQTVSKAVLAKRTSDPRYWRRNGGSLSGISREDMAAMNQAQREFSDALRAAFGPDATVGLYRDSRFDFLPVAKQDELRRIEQDYNELQSEILRDSAGIQLPADRAKLALLRAEKEKDIMALLSPEEREQYDLHSSTTAQNVRNRFGDGLASEEDYKKIFALQKAFDQKFPDDFFGGPTDQNAQRERSAAQQQLNTDVQNALGPDKFAALRRANDPEFQAATSLTQRLNLPAGTADNLFATREAYAASSQRINADTSLNPMEKRAQIQALAAQAKNDLASNLGPDGAAAFAPRARWLNYLQGGTAFTTNPNDSPMGAAIGLGGSSVFPVLPSGTRITGSTSQSSTNTINVNPDGSRTIISNGGTVIFSGSGGGGGGGAPVIVPATPAPKN